MMTRRHALHALALVLTASVLSTACVGTRAAETQVQGTTHGSQPLLCWLLFLIVQRHPHSSIACVDFC